MLRVDVEFSEEHYTFRANDAWREMGKDSKDTLVKLIQGQD